MVTRRGSRSFSLSDLDHSEGEQSLLTLNAPRRQSLGLGVTHCPLPYVQEEEEKEEGDDDEEVCGFDISIYILYRDPFLKKMSGSRDFTK